MDFEIRGPIAGAEGWSGLEFGRGCIRVQKRFHKGLKGNRSRVKGSATGCEGKSEEDLKLW